MKKTVLITGGAGGIGAACARRLAGEYNLIIACNKSRERALELQRELSPLCDCTVAVTSQVELRVRRIMERDGIDEKYARLRISAQQQDDYFREKCDRELSNTAQTPREFRETAREFFARLIEQIKEDKATGRK